MEKSKYLLKNIGILTLSNFSSKILVFLLVPLYTSVLSTAEYGSYDLCVSTATLLYPIFTLNIVEAVMRFLMDKTKDKKDITSIGLKYVIISVLLFGILMLLFSVTGWWNDIHGYENLIFLYFITFVFNQFLIQFTKGIDQVKEMAIAGVLGTITTIVSNILFLWVFKFGLNGFFVANIFSQLVSALYLGIQTKIWKYINLNKINVPLQKEMLRYSVPLIATTIGWWVNSTSDKYVVSVLLGVSANGLLSVSYKIPQIMATFQSIFTQAWSISAIKEYGEQDTAKFYGNTFTIVNLFICAACSWLILLTKPLAHILYAKDFYQAWQYVPFLLIASVLNCASGLLGPILSAQKNSKAMMWSALIGAGANIILNITLVRIIGIQGATIATVICSYIIYAVRKTAVKKEITIDHYATILITWILLSIQATMEIYISIWWLEALTMIILLIINVPTLKKLIKSVQGALADIKNKK